MLNNCFKINIIYVQFMSNASTLEPISEQPLEAPSLNIQKCLNCGSDETKFLDVSIWSGRFFSKCLECSWLFAEN